MQIGVPCELKNHEYRVAITPGGARELDLAGHTVFVEAGAGTGSSFSDGAYLQAGATIVPTADELWARADLVLKVKEPVPEEFHRMRAGQVLFTFLHLAADRKVTQALMDTGITAIAYETVELADGRLPLLAPMSEVAGRMAPQAGAHLLEREQGGRGVLMGGLPGVRAARVVVIGAGMAGQNAARIAQGMEAEVTLLDTNIDKLRAIDDIHGGRIRTLMSNRATIEELAVDADLIIGSVLVPGAKAPKLVTADLVRKMHKGTVLVDIAIDQGGCFETSHVTTHDNPTYIVDGVVHYCVGNMPGAVPHTSTHALTNMTLPYVMRLAANGVNRAVSNDDALAKGVNVWNGELTCAPVASAHGLSWRPLADVMGVSDEHVETERIDLTADTDSQKVSD